MRTQQGGRASWTYVRKSAIGMAVASILGALVTPLLAVTPAGAANTPALTVSTSQVDLGKVTLGDFNSNPGIVVLTNTGSVADTLTPPDLTVTGANPLDFFAIPANIPADQNNCTSNSDQSVFTIPPAGTCDFLVGFLPGEVGPRSAVFTIASEPAGSSTSFTAMGTGTEGYYVTTSTGVVDTFGDAQYWGDTSHSQLKAPIVGMAQTGDDGGYWLVGSDGGIFAFGDAPFFGGTGSLVLNKPIVGMADTADVGGYWLVASDGGIFTFGDAQFYGSTGAIRLNKPIVGMAETSDGNGYWLVASDGGIFAFGDAPFYGSTGNITLNKPIVGMAVTPDGGGYWLVASDGGIFAFGDAQFFGSTGAIHLNQPIVGMAASPTGLGYWMVASDGGIFAFGDTQFLGSAGGTGITNAAGMANSGTSTLQAATDTPAIRAHERALLTAHWHLR